MTTTTNAPPAEVTPEELLTMPDGDSYELVDGKLVERHMGLESSEIALRIAFLILSYLQEHRLGRLFGADASYQCFQEEPKKVRKPDVSFIRSERLPGDRLPRGHCPFAPDLTIEVVSPGDSSYEIEEKVAEYLRAGVQLVWVVHPPTRTVRIHRPHNSPHGRISELAESDTITGEDVLPGFSCAAKQFFA